MSTRAVTCPVHGWHWHVNEHRSALHRCSLPVGHRGSHVYTGHINGQRIVIGRA